VRGGGRRRRWGRRGGSGPRRQFGLGNLIVVRAASAPGEEQRNAKKDGDEFHNARGWLPVQGEKPVSSETEKYG
jgi:hypothetical protein